MFTKLSKATSLPFSASVQSGLEFSDPSFVGQKEGSDVDIIVEFEEGKKTFRNYLNLAKYLEALLNRKVELVTWESLASFVQRNVKEEIEYVSFAD